MSLVYNVKLFEKVRREFWNNCLSTDKVSSMIHQILKWSFFKNHEHRRGVYKQIR